jgi:peptide/nickel transport system permease protein
MTGVVEASREGIHSSEGRLDGQRVQERRWDVLRRFGRNRAAIFGACILVLLIVVALFAPFLAPADPLTPNFSEALRPPSANHPFGTDHMGRDIYARVVHGSRISLRVGFLSVIIGGLVGTVLGVLSGYFGGWADRLVMRGMDVMLALPAILLAIVVVTWLGPSLTNAMLAIAIIRIPRTARLMRSVVLTIMPKEFILACRVIGVSDPRILVRHVLPNAISPLIVESTIGLAFSILTAAGLGFLGLGAQPPTPEWGAMISEGRTFLYSAFQVTMFPGLAILATTVSVNLVGDGLQDALNPRLIS